MSTTIIAADLVGQRFGRLQVIARATVESKRSHWHCLCDCGREKVIMGKNMRRGQTRSCGCLRREVHQTASVTHGMSKTPTYGSWASMLSRCYNANQDCYQKYGALGVTVCDRWRESFANFLADMGVRPEGMTLDRRNPFGNYEPANCKWSTAQEQSLNRRGQVAIAILQRMTADGVDVERYLQIVSCPST